MASDATPQRSAQAEAPKGKGGASPCSSNDCVGQVAPAEPERCDTPIVVYRDGARAGEVCDPAGHGLTVVNLGDAHAPRVLAGGGELGPVAYRERFLRLARHAFGDDDTWYRDRFDRYHELYGIFPAPSLVAGRLADEARHRCHDAVPREALEALAEGIDTWRPLSEQRADHGWHAALTKKLESMQKALRLDSVDELADHPQLGGFHRQWRMLGVRHAAIAEAQAHFRCDGLLDDDPHRDGLLDTPTIEALQTYLRRHMVITWQLDEETKAIVLTNSRELDYRQLLRSLRERVVAATGLIEDGTAVGQHGEVVGRIIDTATLVHEHDGVVLEGGAPDLIAAATDAAAQHLGWTSPEAALAFWQSDVPAAVALPLPKPPAYHSDNMELVARIDRGDVWFDFPFVPRGDRVHQPRDRKPTLVLYARDGERAIPLVRWPTTIGGWQPERINGDVKLAYKESPEGSFIWRDLIAAPSWIPPSSTPTRDLLRPKGGGQWAPRYDIMGPSYASAYGMAMLIHHRVDQQPDGTTVLSDGGIRSHGSVSYASIMDGFSHGCHRLHNHRMLRLADFLLAHRPHQVRGPLSLDYGKSLFFRGKRYPLAFDSRGFRYELTPPIEVEVLRGNTRGYAQRPLPPRPPTRPMLMRYD